MKLLPNNFVTNIKKLFTYNEPKKYNFVLSETSNENSLNEGSLNMSYEQQVNQDKAENIQKIYPLLSANLDFIKIKYNSLINQDIIIREFKLIAKDKTYNAFLVYIDGMVNTTDINDFILKPLMLRNKSNLYEDKEKIAISSNISVKRTKKFNLQDHIIDSLMPQNSVKATNEFLKIIDSINAGNTALFIDTLDVVFDIELKGFEHRTVATANNEIVVRGSQEAFVEVLRVNTALLRRIINNENLIIENTNVGNVTKTNVGICYIKNIVNSDLLAEVKYRLNNIDLDAIISSGQLEQMIEDNSFSLFPQMLATERPDKAANHLLEGRVVILINGSPYALVVPVILIDFLSSPEDINLRSKYANLLRLIRIVAFSITLLLPAAYIAVAYYHEELLPTELLFAIAVSRETVPFPILFEILIMEFSFELIREAGLRVPSPIGPTIGIVGALILGESAVSANIVSPILIIIVSITAICSFAIPSYELSFTVRILRFVYILLAFLGGFLGIAVGLFIQIAILSSLRTFGVPYLSPYLPVSGIAKTEHLFLQSLWKRERRPDFLNTKRPFQESPTSKKWER